MNLRGEVKPVMAAGICLVAAGVITGGGYLWLNPKDVPVWPPVAANPLYSLVLSDILVSTNYIAPTTGLGGGGFTLSPYVTAVEVKARPVTYLPTLAPPNPTPNAHPAVPLSASLLER